MANGIIRRNADRNNRYELIDPRTDSVVLHSSSIQYIIDRATGKTASDKVANAGITGFEFEADIKETMAGSSNTEVELGYTPLEDYDINERFEFTETLVNMVLDGTISSTIIAGNGGVGKTKTVIDCLHARGLEDVSDYLLKQEQEQKEADQKKKAKKASADEESEDENEDYDIDDIITEMKGDYIFVKGFSTAKGLFRTLYECNNKIIIFDDCDSIHKNQDAVNVLKGALDTYERRIVCWNAEAPFGSDLPKRFEFTGKIIFITNLKLSRIDEALKTRALCVDLSTTKQQMLDRIQAIVTKNEMTDDDFGRVEQSIKQEVVDFMREKLDIMKDVNFRIFKALIKIRLGDHSESWTRLAEYVVLQG